MRSLLVLLVALFLAACSGGAEKDATVVVKPGSTLTAAAREMEAAGAISSASAFLRHVKIFGSSAPIKPGEYELKSGMSAGDILALMQAGRTKQRFVIVPEGMPSAIVHDRLMRAEFLIGAVPVPAEGSVLPDAYAYTRGESRAAVVARMQAAMAKTLAAAWKNRKPTTVARSPAEAVNLASIVEKETAKADERRMVAGVLSNRLRTGMMLGADATTIYPITRGRPLGRMIRVSELRDPNPYNTRAIAGLPAGPITNPGREAIAAVLDPAPTRALFYVADGSGGHAFAETLAQHNANVAKWRALRRSRGEM